MLTLHLCVCDEEACNEWLYYVWYNTSATDFLH